MPIPLNTLEAKINELGEGLDRDERSKRVAVLKLHLEVQKVRALQGIDAELTNLQTEIAGLWDQLDAITNNLRNLNENVSKTRS